MDSTTILVLLLMGIVIVVLGYYMIKGFVIFRRRKKSTIKTPKVKGRAILRDKRFGSARVVGYEPMGYGFERCILWLMSWDGHLFKIPYHSSELMPENNIQAIAGAHSPVWRVRGLNNPDGICNESFEIQKENTEMKEDKIKQKVKSKQVMNESVLMPDKMDEIIKEMQKPRQQDVRLFK
mgnify:FL=1